MMDTCLPTRYYSGFPFTQAVSANNLSTYVNNPTSWQSHSGNHVSTSLVLNQGGTTAITPSTLINNNILNYISNVRS